MYFPKPLNLKPNVKNIKRGTVYETQLPESYQSDLGYHINHNQHSITSFYYAMMNYIPSS
jgi:hypothetical protein